MAMEYRKMTKEDIDYLNQLNAKGEDIIDFEYELDLNKTMITLKSDNIYIKHQLINLREI